MDKANPNFLDWNGRIGAGRGGAFKQAVGEAIRRVLRVSMVIDPVHNVNAQDIVETIPEACQTVQAFSVDELETIMIQATVSCNDEDLEETIEDSSVDGKKLVSFPSSDGQRESGVCNTGEESL